MRFSMLTALLLIAVINETLACECGIEGYFHRVIYGTEARAHKYPWLAHIRSFTNRGKRSYYQCGGSLIDETHVITAAHCVVDDNKQAYSPERIDVFLGRVKAFSESSKPYAVSKVWIDPKYDRKTLANDFAILTLSEPVKYSDKIRPVCLPNSENGLSKLTVTGWGRTGGNEKASDDLMEAEVDFINKTECNDVVKTFLSKKKGIPLESMNDFEGVPDSQMCAINKETKGDTCPGDSGGPLMRHGDNRLWYLMGVTSGALTLCGPDKDTPSFYTRIFYYKDVIKSMAPNACWQDL